MKQTIWLVAFIFTIGFQAGAQHITPNRVPAQVGKAFRDKFPMAQQDSWSMEDGHTYEVDFFNGKKKQSATFDESGKWLETETEIGINQAPVAVAKTYMKLFSGYNIQDAYQQEKPDSTSYEITAVKGHDSYDLLFSAKGDLLKKVPVSREE
jgi:Putative beta-lactamase-inhibitor-like, PepSY-like